ncbi:MAG: hypothetical protein P8Y81_06020 [Ignavibacteriaceae bacterium]
MKRNIAYLILLLATGSCKTPTYTYSTHLSTVTYRRTTTSANLNSLDTIKYGNMVLDFGTEHIESDKFIGYLTVDTAANQSELTLSMNDFLKGNDSTYNIFMLHLYMDTATHRPDLGIHKLYSTDKLRYHVNGSKGTPYFPLNASVRLTRYDSINLHAYKLSGDFNFFAAKTKFFLKKGDTDFRNARMEYYDSVLVSGKFDSIYFNFYYESINEKDVYQSQYDTIPFIEDHTGSK